MDHNILTNILRCVDANTAKRIFLAGGASIFKSAHKLDLIQHVDVRECRLKFSFRIPKNNAIDICKGIHQLFEIKERPSFDDMMSGAEMTCFGRSYADVVEKKGFECKLIIPLTPKYLLKLLELMDHEIMFYNQVEITRPWPRPESYKHIVILDIHDTIQIRCDEIDHKNNVFVVNVLDLVNKVHKRCKQLRASNHMLI